MAHLSSAASTIQDLGIAASIGGTLFGRAALQPALYKIALPEERDLVSADAWRRFSWINLLGHAAFTVPWLLERTLLRDKHIGRRARPLVAVKDILIGASLLTGVASVLLSRRLAERNVEGRGPQASKVPERFGLDPQTVARTRAIRETVGTLGLVNLITTAGIAAVTAMLHARRGQP